MTKQQASIRITKLKKQLREIDYAYYVLDKPIVTDAARDSLKDELEKLEQQFPEFITPDSPTQRIGGKALGKFIKHRHRVPKYSIDDVFSFAEVREFDQRVKRLLGLSASQTIEYICELKIDGLNMSYLYKKGALDMAVTRGDGVTGEVVTHTVRTIGSVPLRIKEAIDLEVGGEVFMPKASFEKVNRQQKQKGETLFANPRNAAAGTIRQLDPRVAATRDLDSFMYSYNGQKNFKTHEETLKELGRLGFKVTTQWKKITGIGGAEKVFAYWAKRREDLPFEIDGMVVKVNRLDYQQQLGRTAKHIRWAVAYKFPAQQATTVVKSIEVQVGRTGVLTPVAHLEPTRLAGSVVKRATLHNQDEIDRLDVRIGDTVILQKAGDVIPDIVRVLPKLRTGQEKKFKMPAQCPICGSPVKRRAGEVAYYCGNLNCYDQQRRSLFHFVAKGAFDIDGLGPKILEQLLKADLIKDAPDIFRLKEDDLRPLERFADKSAVNLIQAVQARRKIDLSRFIYALGIRHIGEESAITLAREFGSLERIKQATVNELQAAEDIGPKVAASIYEWFRDKKNLALLEKFSQAGVTIINPPKKSAGKLAGKIFVLTGGLASLSRDEAKQKVRDWGGVVSASVSAKTDYVVAGAKPGSKYDQAKKLGVKVIDEREFLKLIK